MQHSTQSGTPDEGSLRAAAHAGDGRASARLGDLYREGESVEQNWDEAFRWYSLGASQGNADAQSNLGTMFLRGLGCAADATQAVFWYRKSAEQGHVLGQFNLAERYLNGEGVAPDLAEAFEWFSAAARQGDMPSTCRVGTMYRFGQGVERNVLAAANFHVIAATAGFVAAQAEIGEYLEELQDIALSGNQTASWFLCLIHNRGLGVEKSQALTWTWIKWAKEHCTPSDHAPEAAEVDEMYTLSRMCIMDESREEGDRVLDSLLEPFPRTPSGGADLCSST
jgi:hypothetical protein